MNKSVFVLLAAASLAAGTFGLTTASVDYAQYRASATPSAVMLSFARGANSRGFAWQTDASVTESKVWVLEGTFSEADADRFTREGRLYTGTCSSVVPTATGNYLSAVNCHKVFVTGLRFGASYSYRLGGNGHFIYGAFSLRDVQDEVTILNLNDAQPKDLTKLYVWENTASRAVEQAGGASALDFVVYGGDLYDENAPLLMPAKYRQWGISAETATRYLPGVPWAFSQGNHDYTVYNDTTAVDYDHTISASGATMGCQSFDYGRVHVATVPYLGGWSASTYGSAATWLDGDLRAARASGRTDWIVVAMHWGVYVSGDHFVDVAGSKDLLRRFAPIMASNHVDLVVQAHDHVYTKTLPYRWDGAGVTTTFNNGAVVNLNPATQTIGGTVYDVDPNGTYYVSAGCAGHRVGDGNEGYANAELNDPKCYRNCEYKIETGRINVDSEYRHVGDNASADLSASMFGVLKVKGDTLSYDWYAVATNGLSAPVLFDTLRVKKTLTRARTFSVTPYVQHPATNAMSVIWFTKEPGAAKISWRRESGGDEQSALTSGVWAEALTNNQYTADAMVHGRQYRHRHRIVGLEAGTRYSYTVELANGVSYSNTFKTAPGSDSSVRFIYYNDSETEPGDKYTTDWTDPANNQNRAYYVTKNTGYASNIVHMVRREPDLFVIAGDLASHGGQQQNWDEFWKHNAGGNGIGYNDPAGSIPIVAAIGNHDLQDQERQRTPLMPLPTSCENPGGGESALERYLSYFEYEPNGVNYVVGDGETFVGNDRDRSQMFHRLDYGPVTFIFLDTNNGDDSDPERDTNTGLFRDPANPYGMPAGRSPDFNPGSKQYCWLTNNLADAQRNSKFTFVVNHHCPYSVGYHNRTNVVEGGEWLSARAVRALDEAMIKYGVDGWLCGHDEMVEHSRISGTEILPDGTSRPKTVEIFDMGTAGDGLRGQQMTKEYNPKEVWRAHKDAPEVWSNGVLMDGGKHYGHMEIEVKQEPNGGWTCTMTPVYIFVNKINGVASTFERRVYDDVTVLTKAPPALPDGYRYGENGEVECRMTVDPDMGGEVLLNGEPVLEGDEVWFAQGSEITLTAENDGTTVFAGWTGDTSTIFSGFASSPEVKLRLDGPLDLTANWTTTKFRYWNPTTTTKEGNNNFYKWNTAANWRDANNAKGVPVAGDTAIFGSDSKSSSPHTVSGGSSANPLYEVRFENKTTVSVNQGSFALKTGGKGLQYLRNANNTGNWAGLRLCGNGEVPVNIANNVTYAMQKSCLVGSGTPTVVKVGPGTFVNCNEAGNYDYTVPVTLLRQGTWDISVAKVLNGCVIGFDGNDASQVLRFCYNNYSLPLQIKDGGIFETNGVANTQHAISANGKDQQVIFTGTPKFNPMVFSGRLTNGAGIRWSPVADENVFVFSNAVSETSGRIFVDKGTVRLVAGASFTSLSEVSVANGAVFDVQAGAGANFAATDLTLAGSEAKLQLGAGVALTFDAATLAGTALAAKTYSATGANGTKRVAWIEGEGTVTVETGPENSDVWCGAGADTSTSTDLNWLTGTAPDVTAGGLLATFATGGAEARLPGSVSADFSGLVLNPAFGGSTFTFAASGATAALYENGINSTAAASPVTWLMGWPLEVAAAQTWNVTANNTLKLTAPLSGSSSLNVVGAGGVEFAATSTHSGGKNLQCANVKVSASNALGTSAGTVAFHHLTSKLDFAGEIALDSPFYSSDQCESFTSFMTVEPNARVTFNGSFGYRSDGGITFGAGSVTTFRGGVKFDTDGMKGRLVSYGSGTVVITNKPLSTCRSYIGQANNPITFELAVAGNALNDGSYWAHFPSGRLVTRVADAVYVNGRSTWLDFGNAEFDLAGHDQRLDLLKTTSQTRITSASPALLTILSSNTGICQDGEMGGTNRVDAAVYSGCVSVKKSGAYPHVFGATSTSTGAVEVTQGVVTMNASGKWPNATEVRVTGGKVVLKNAEAFGPNAAWRVTTGGTPVVALDYVGTNTAAKLFVGGQRQPYGFWGAAGSGAEHEAPWISGTGILHVTSPSMTIVVR